MSILDLVGLNMLIAGLFLTLVFFQYMEPVYSAYTYKKYSVVPANVEIVNRSSTDQENDKSKAYGSYINSELLKAHRNKWLPFYMLRIPVSSVLFTVSSLVTQNMLLGFFIGIIGTAISDIFFVVGERDVEEKNSIAEQFGLRIR